METHDIIDTLADTWHRRQRAVAEWPVGHYPIDEVAVCFYSEDAQIAFVEEAVQSYGLEHFNSVPHDTMRRQDKLGESFDVRFEFLRLPGRPWRIEAMAILEGDAPLHADVVRVHGDPCVIHASYKLPDLGTYQEHQRWMHQATGQKKRGEYLNDYGLFSYWTSDSHVYLKPRVNLRDV